MNVSIFRIFSETAIVFYVFLRYFAREIGVQPARNDAFAHAQRLTAVLETC